MAFSSTYLYIGASVQTHTVTVSGTYYIAMWGGAGGPGRYIRSYTNWSGGGGVIVFKLDVVAGDVITMEVGGGGEAGKLAVVAGGDGGWPDGGFGALGDVRCGGGGGSTRLYLNGTLIAVAGAGGGSSGYTNTRSGGAGGGSEGQSSESTTGGTGGTQIAGGYDASAPTNAAKKGGYLQGGKGGDVPNRFTNTSDDGAGGGGGYYGGGGGGGDGDSGGGGSSWCHPTRVTEIASATGYYQYPGYWDWGVLPAGVGYGKQAFSEENGEGGAVVIQDYQFPPVPVGISAANGYSVQRPRGWSISGAKGYAVLDVTHADISTYRAYAVLQPSPPTVVASKATGYVILDASLPPDPDFMVSRASTYAVLFDSPERYAFMSKASGYAVLKGEFRFSKFTNYAVLDDPTPRHIRMTKAEGYAVLGSTSARLTKTTGYALLDATPRPEARITKASGYAVMGIIHPRVFLSDILAESVTGGNPQVRLSQVGVEAVTKGKPVQVRLSQSLAEVVTGGNPEVRCSFIGAEVVCAVPEEPFMLNPDTHTFPTLVGLAFNVKKSPEFSTRVAGTASGQEVRNAFWDDPRWNYELSYDLLRDRPVGNLQSELKKIAGFFMQRRGKFEAFLFKDPDDNEALNAQGLTDGLTLTFPLRRDFGGFNERIGQLNEAEAHDFWFRIVGEGEGHTVPSTPGPYTVTAAKSAQYRANVRVTLADGTPLARVDVAPAAMQYSVNTGTGVYTFNAAQQGAGIKLYYEYGIDSGDYSIQMPNKLVFGVAPPAGLELWGSFQFYFVCRFDEDAHEYEKFMDKLWELQQCTFKSLIQ